MISITLNGEAREVPAAWTVARLLENLGHDPRTVAVERNGEILPRGRFAETRLEPGDRIEIVRFVQGG